MKIYQIFSESALRNFTYLIAWEGRAICIDPFDARQVKDILEKHSLVLEAIINTHEHWDHFCGNKDLIEFFHCEVWAHEGAKEKIPGINRFLKNGDRIDLSSQSYLQVLETPGHTFAHVCLLLFLDGKPLGIFTGDTLFNAGVGNCKSGGDAGTLYHTVKEKLGPLGDEILVYPGHEYREKNLLFTLNLEEDNHWATQLLQDHRKKLESAGLEKNVNYFLVTNMGVEKKVNVFFRLKERAIQQKVQLKGDEEKELFMELRKLRDHW